jgi:hypothetical protein
MNRFCNHQIVSHLRRGWRAEPLHRQVRDDFSFRDGVDIIIDTVPCSECELLMERYRLAVAALVDAMVMLKSGKTGEEFNLLLALSEERWITCGKALEALEAHRSDHAC